MQFGRHRQTREKLALQRSISTALHPRRRHLPIPRAEVSQPEQARSERSDREDSANAAETLPAGDQVRSAAAPAMRTGEHAD